MGIELNTESSECGKGFWKFNSALLKEHEYVTLVKNEINNLISELTEGQGSQTLTTSKQMFFEVLKLRIRGVTIPYCAKCRKKLNEKEKKV